MNLCQALQLRDLDFENSSILFGAALDSTKMPFFVLWALLDSSRAKGTTVSEPEHFTKSKKDFFPSKADLLGKSAEFFPKFKS